jgi:hypothetical protein
VVGIAVIAVCALLGARLLDASDDTVPVWAARGSLAEGQPLTAADVTRRQVRFADRADADRYLSAESALPDGTVLARAVGAGELLPRAAVGPAGTGDLTEVPLSVGTEAVPATVRVGTVVDVWVTPDGTLTDAGSAAGAAPGGPAPRSTLVFDDVAVVSAPRTSTSLGPAATRQVIVGVGGEQLSRLPRALAALAGGTVVLTAPR